MGYISLTVGYISLIAGYISLTVGLFHLLRAIYHLQWVIFHLLRAIYHLHILLLNDNHRTKTNLSHTEEATLAHKNTRPHIHIV